MERFLYRLSASPHADKFILKGALMLAAWESPQSRPTMDIDLLGRMSNDLDLVADVVREVCRQKVPEDGLSFSPDSVEAARITEDADYEGVRVRFRANLGNARVGMRLDVGFGDIVTPAESDLEYPTILDFPPPRLKGYSRESTVAEKLEAMVRLGELNSRMKDFYDIWLLSKRFDFSGSVLSQAIEHTFRRRETAVPPEPVGLTGEFARDPMKATQWTAFIRRSNLTGAPADFTQVVKAIDLFLGPVAKSLAGGELMTGEWPAGGPWCTDSA